MSYWKHLDSNGKKVKHGEMYSLSSGGAVLTGKVKWHPKHGYVIHVSEVQFYSVPFTYEGDGLIIYDGLRRT